MVCWEEAVFSFDLTYPMRCVVDVGLGVREVGCVCVCVHAVCGGD